MIFAVVIVIFTPIYIIAEHHIYNAINYVTGDDVRYCKYKEKCDYDRDVSDPRFCKKHAPDPSDYSFSLRYRKSNVCGLCDVSPEYHERMNHEYRAKMIRVSDYCSICGYHEDSIYHGDWELYESNTNE